MIYTPPPSPFSCLKALSVEGGRGCTFDAPGAEVPCRPPLFHTPPTHRKFFPGGGVRGQGPLNGGVSNGGVSRSGLVLPFLSFFVLFGTFPIFPGFSRFAPGTGPGIFPICPFPLSRPIKSTYEEQSRKGPRHNPDLSRKKWETPGFGNPPV